MIKRSSSQPTDDELWSEFLGFIPEAPNAASPLELFVGFEEQLRSAGRTEEEAGADRARVLRLTNERQDWIGPMFDRIYASDAPNFNQAPNELLSEIVASERSGRALDIAMGQGRNSVFLATIGWHVTGIDVSPQGIAVAEAGANRAGVTIDARQVGIEEFELGSEQWDLIVLTYALVPVADVVFANRIVDSLAPGGLLVIESFGSNRDATNRRPVDLDPDELRAAYRALETIRFEDEEALPDWTDRSARVVRMAARKPFSSDGT
ncbi:MAG: class I SAM-dependent methyltransferase [Acidimicrobiia bacterium]